MTAHPAPCLHELPASSAPRSPAAHAAPVRTPQTLLPASAEHLHALLFRSEAFAEDLADTYRAH